MRVVKNREEDRTLLTQLALSLGFEETCSKLHDNCLSEIRADARAIARIARRRISALDRSIDRSIPSTRRDATRSAHSPPRRSVAFGRNSAAAHKRAECSCATLLSVTTVTRQFVSPNARVPGSAQVHSLASSDDVAALTCVACFFAILLSRCLEYSCRLHYAFSIFRICCNQDC